MTDQELVQETIKNPEKYAALVEKYEEKLLRYVRNFLYVTVEDAEDLVQETFIHAYKYILSYNSNLSFSSWIYRIAHNQCVSYLRKHHARFSAEHISTQNEDEDNKSEQIMSDENVEENVEKILRHEHVIKKLKDLDPASREVLILRYLEEKEYSEIADILKVPEGTIASLIHRAKNKFKALLTHEQYQ